MKLNLPIVLGAGVGCVIGIWLGHAHAATIPLGDCAVFPPAPVRVVHRPHHFAHHRVPVCHCDEQLGGPVGSGASGGGFSFNGGSGDGSGSYGDVGSGGDGGGGSPPLAAAGGLILVGGSVLYYVSLVDSVGENYGPLGDGSPVLVPEPSTLALVAIGAGAMLLKWRVS